jgi:Mn2+/Fe2+ NRAMP family transporter
MGGHPERPTDPHLMPRRFIVGGQVALILTSTVYGFLAPPLLVLLLLVTNRRAIMGERTNGWLLNTLGGIAALATGVGAAGLVVLWLLPG